MHVYVPRTTQAVQQVKATEKAPARRRWCCELPRCQERLSPDQEALRGLQRQHACFRFEVLGPHALAAANPLSVTLVTTAGPA